MPIDKRTIDHLEKLARIELTPEEKTRLSVQLERIVGYVKQLHQIDTGTLDPSGPALHAGGTQAPLRPDEPGTCVDRDKVLDEAPDSKNHLFRVPRIIER
jgi:aspartyl-tRNA(Asn)/glutamyl-tRNA(Gln) amidotransferase subunit C